MDRHAQKCKLGEVTLCGTYQNAKSGAIPYLYWYEHA